jgi:prevent-host-death family protein
MAKRGTVGARELKTRLGTYLRRVRQGETLIVTERGEPAAELRPVLRGRSAEEAALAKLQARGAVSRRARRPLTRFRSIRSRGKPVSEAVIEDREERF